MLSEAEVRENLGRDQRILAEEKDVAAGHRQRGKENAAEEHERYVVCGMQEQVNLAKTCLYYMNRVKKMKKAVANRKEQGDGNLRTM